MEFRFLTPSCPTMLISSVSCYNCFRAVIDVSAVMRSENMVQLIIAMSLVLETAVRPVVV